MTVGNIEKPAGKDPAIKKVLLNVRSPEILARFYVELLGMEAASDGDDIRLRYSGGTALILRKMPGLAPYSHDHSDRYWKIAISLPDLDVACAQLRSREISVSDPVQFEDVGYLAHLTDPEGFQIELLQHSFAGAPKTCAGDPDLPLGGGARLALITLRTNDIESELVHFRDALGMRLIGIQPVESHGFTLYFLSLAGETPPNSDLTALENRPWLYQREQASLEFQHVHRRNRVIEVADPGRCGYAGVTIASSESPSYRFTIL